MQIILVTQDLLLASDYHPASDSQLQTQVLIHVQKHQTWCSSLQLLAQGIFFEEILLEKSKKHQTLQ